MKTKFLLSLALATLMVAPGCVSYKHSKNGEIESTKQVQFLKSDCKPECVKTEEPKTAKYPALYKCKVKSKLNYQIKTTGGNQVYTNLKLGEFQASETDMQLYSTLAKNGLVSISSKAIMNPNGEYSTWINVGLTELGKTYIFNQNGDNTLSVENGDFLDFFNPARDRDEYGELWEDPNIPEKAKTLLNSFYAAYAEDPAKAVDLFGEEELIAAHKRMTVMTSFCHQLGCPAPVFENIFTYGKRAACGNFVFMRLPKYKNAYKVSFTGGSTIVVTDDAMEKIFDVVVNMPWKYTLKEVNKTIEDARIAALYERTKLPVTQEPATPSRKYYAPGLVSRQWKDAHLELAEINKPFIYDVMEASAVSYTVPVCLYKVEIDKIHKIKRFAKAAEADKFGSYDRYYAKAELVVKKIDITPFQYIMQKFDRVYEVTNMNLYTTHIVKLEYFKDCGWNVADSEWNLFCN